MAPTTIDIRGHDLELVKTILQNHVPEYEVWAFGSRVSGTAWEYSDLDLVIITDKPLDILRLAELKEAFSESALPFKVDVLDRSRTNERFLKRIEAEYLVIRNKS